MNINCPCCLSNIVENGVILDESDTVSDICSDQSHLIHKSCLLSLMSSYVDVEIGKCSQIYCPHLHNKNDRRILRFEKWCQVVDKSVEDKYIKQANSLVSILCGSCHVLRSIGVSYSETIKSEAAKTLLECLSSELSLRETLFQALLLFEYGESTLEICYSKILELIPKLQISDDKEAWNIFKLILVQISNPERRVNLHLRYLRDHPKIWTVCCDSEHCFRCKTKDGHRNVTCEENMQLLGDVSIVHCPGCNVALIKSDGCDSVTCICTRVFSWYKEKETAERVSSFSQRHPVHTNRACVDVICGKVVGLVEHARAWRERNMVLANQAFLELWQTTYPHCPTQAAVVKASEINDEGMKIARETWVTVNPSQVAKCKEQNSYAKAAYFLSMFPTDLDRFCVTRRLFSSSQRYQINSDGVNDKHLQDSARLWLDSNRAVYNRYLEEWELQSAFQYLHIFGSYTLEFVSKVAVNEYLRGPFEWNRERSNPYLTYSANNTAVARGGHVHCYPAAFAALTGPEASFVVLLERAKCSTNMVTFGLTTKSFPNGGSEGVGRTHSSWGIEDEREVSSTSTAVFMSCGNVVGECRKLVEGDILRAVVNTTEGWLEITVNDNEYIHRFEIPQTDCYMDYCFAVTLANDHRVSIVANNQSTISGGVGAANGDHREMYFNLCKYLRKLLTDEEFSKSETNDVMISRHAEEWEVICGGGYEEALHRFYQFDDQIQSILNCPSLRDNSSTPAVNSTSISTATEDYTDSCTWNQLFRAISWYALHKQRIESEECMELAQQFISEHMESSPLMAAAILMSPIAHGQWGESTVNQAKAFVKLYSDDMQEWYHYNATLEEPLVDMSNVARGCMCVPRHCGHCPKT